MDIMSTIPTVLPGVPLDIPPDETEATITEVVSKYEFAKSNMEDSHSTWNDIREAYYSEKTYTTPEGVKEPEARIHTPMMAALIDRLVAMNTIRVVQPFNNFILARYRKTKQRAYKIENYLFDMFKERNMASPIVQATMSAALYGVGFTKVIPDIESAEPKCLVQAVNNWDIFIDPWATSIEDASFIIHRIYLSYDAVKARMGRYYNKKQCQRMFDEIPIRQDIGTGVSQRVKKVKTLLSNNVYRTDMRSAEPDIENTKYDRYCIYEYYDGWNIITVGEEKYLLRSRQEFQGYPFQAWKLRMETAGEFWVKSHGEYLLPLQQESDIKRNQRIENINKINNPLCLYNVSALGKTDPNKLIYNSGHKIPVNDIDQAIKFVEVQDATALNLQEVEYIKSEGESLTAVTPVVQGMSAKKERMTNQETSSVYNQANMAFDFSSSMLVTSGLIPMFRSILHYCGSMFLGEFATATESPNGVGPDVPIAPEEFMDDYDIDVSINPNKEQLDAQRATQAYQLFSQNPYIDQVVLLNYIIPMMFPDYPREIIKQMPMDQPMPENTQLSNNAMQ